MPHSPALVPVERRTPPRTARARGIPSAVVGALVGIASFLPFLHSLLTR